MADYQQLKNYTSKDVVFKFITNEGEKLGHVTVPAATSTDTNGVYRAVDLKQEVDYVMVKIGPKNSKTSLVLPVGFGKGATVTTPRKLGGQRYSLSSVQCCSPSFGDCQSDPANADAFCTQYVVKPYNPSMVADLAETVGVSPSYAEAIGITTLTMVVLSMVVIIIIIAIVSSTFVKTKQINTRMKTMLNMSFPRGPKPFSNQQ